MNRPDEEPTPRLELALKRVFAMGGRRRCRRIRSCAIRHVAQASRLLFHRAKTRRLPSATLCSPRSASSLHCEPAGSSMCLRSSQCDSPGAHPLYSYSNPRNSIIRSVLCSYPHMTHQAAIRARRRCYPARQRETSTVGRIDRLVRCPQSGTTFLSISHRSPAYTCDRTAR